MAFAESLCEHEPGYSCTDYEDMRLGGGFSAGGSRWRIHWRVVSGGINYFELIKDGRSRTRAKGRPIFFGFHTLMTTTVLVLRTRRYCVLRKRRATPLSGRWFLAGTATPHAVRPWLMP